MASNGVSTVLPPVKSVVVYRNGDPFFTGRRFIVNQRQVSTMDAFLNDVTLSIGAPLAVRTLYTPRHGHRVSELDHLQQGAEYVAAGFERFKKLNYLGVGLKRPPVTRAGDPAQAKVLSRPNVSAKWRKVITQPCIIHVFRNGDVLGAAMRFIIPRKMQKNLEQILSLVSEKAMLRTGAVRRLCTLDGVTVMSAEELENGRHYVAVGMERFKKLPYVELLLNKMTGGSADRHYPGDRGIHRRYETRKGLPQDSHSDSALLNSPERDGRRVKSTGDEAVGGALTREVGSEREESSVFHAKPVRVRKHRGTRRAPARAAQPSVFKGAGRRREEVRGAEEVADDESTAVELPVDQRVAEIIEDEEINKTVHAHQTQVPEERMASRRSGERDADELSVSDGEMGARVGSSPTRHTEAQEDLFTEDLQQDNSQDDH
ncbi:doublecortin domain-containing protein 2B isoform X1 [Electrophorus electricus]|uniref:Doublecortin domain-containing protein n=1 Tax=Electrophorus electricus TaxID=8005 RepID=A0A4W4HF34_ELEEL|nr:doublecortin domain-containing protein 2B isoform X1 [Electrophorus electricus]XP_026864069.2 doublecortin domain-containing protein 2B isoform X1 [Electrophorus electricus]